MMVIQTMKKLPKLRAPFRDSGSLSRLVWGNGNLRIPLKVGAQKAAADH
jgi:hypothetical protein